MRRTTPAPTSAAPSRAALAGAALAGAALLVAGAASASAAPPSGHLPGGLPVHLALGDSVAAGVGSVADPESLADLRANGYPALFADDLREDLDCLPASSPAAADGCRQLQYVNLAVPGETTASFQAEGQLAAAVALLRERNTDLNPRNDVEVVTLTLGGNDVFDPVVEACLPLTGPSPSPGCAQAAALAVASAAAGYEEALAALRAAAGPDTVIITMTYYNPLASCVLGSRAVVALADAVLEGSEALGLPVGLNDAIRVASARSGALVADAYGELGPDDLVGGQDCLHPDASGHAVLAGVFDRTFESATRL